jgi:signal transduction histidine kinase
MENLAMLKKMVCLLSCQPRTSLDQLPAALECLCASIAAQAVGVWWRDEHAHFVPHAQFPVSFEMDPDTHSAIADGDDLMHPAWGATQFAWLAVPMKVGGVPLGRLWALAESRREFSQDDREFIMMAGNQLALAQENARLYDEVQHLAARRGELLRRIIATQDERCRRISRELHDEISQSLTAMSLDLEAVQIAPSGSADALARLENLRARVLSALDEVNRIILDLRPTLLEDLGLVAALRWYAQQRLEPIGITIHVQTDGMEHRLQPHIETMLYRIAQEALTNVAKHSRAKNMWLKIARRARHFTLTVRDDGRGFDVEAVLAHPDDRVGIGLFGMRERAALVGGVCQVKSTSRGTSITVRIPAEMEQANESHSHSARR